MTKIVLNSKNGNSLKWAPKDTDNLIQNLGMLSSEILWQDKSVETLLEKLVEESVKWRNDVCCAFPQDTKALSLIISWSRKEKFSAVTRYSALRLVFYSYF
jgi:hypothetical protein